MKSYRVCRSIYTSSIAVFSIAALGCAETEEPLLVGQTSSAVAASCYTTAVSTSPGQGGTVAIDAFDGDVATSLDTGDNGWQYLQVDFGCTVTFSGFRRSMSGGSGTFRALEGERVATSVDGQSWAFVDSAASFGWDSYVSYANDHWHSVPYGWSAWLRPVSPMQVRYVRFYWDGDSDMVDEIDVDSRIVTSSHPAQNGSRTWDIIDGDISSPFDSGYDDWQQVFFNFGEPASVSQVRRHMTGASSVRGAQGERFMFSVDGTSWTPIEASETTGWEQYANYFPTAWHSVDYGWSEWLVLNTAVTAQYWMFDWDGDSDTLDEIEFDIITDGGDAGYDFSPAEAAYASSFSAHASQYTGLGFGTWSDFHQFRVPHNVGLMGTYDGELYGWGVAGRTAVTVILRDDGSEVRGTLLVQQDGMVSYYGGVCGERPLPIDSEMAIRMTPWTSYDGRFSSWDPVYQPQSPYLDIRHFANGSTTRHVDGLFWSGDVTIDLFAMLQVSSSFGSWLVGEVKVDAPNPCDDVTFTLTAKRRKESLAKALGYGP